MLVIKRRPIGDPRRGYDPDKGVAKYIGLPQQSSWQIHTMPNTDGWTNEIDVLSDLRGDGKLTTLFAPTNQRLISDLDLHYDGEWQLAATSVPPAYRAVASGFGPAQLEALGQLLPGHQGGRTFGPECGDGLVWMAVFTGDTGTRALELADVADEIEAVLRGERERGQFDRFVADTLAAVDAEIVEVTP